MLKQISETPMKKRVQAEQALDFAHYLPLAMNIGFRQVYSGDV
jgi:hypothetical protein